MGQLPTWKILKDQFTRLQPVSSFQKDLTGKTVVLTGGTSGVGLEIAKHLVRANPKKIILGCRDLAKGNEVLTILESLGYQRFRAEAWHLDLADFKTITSFVDRFEKSENENENEHGLDLLIQCAGTWFGKYENTVDGWEMNMQTNFLGPALLVLLLLPFLKKATATTRDRGPGPDVDPQALPITPRIILVGSESHYYVHDLPESREPNILEKLNDEAYCISQGPSIGKRYFISKVFILFFTRELSTYLSAPPTIACVTPAFTRTAIFRYDHSFHRGAAFNVARRFLARSPECGSRAVMWAVYYNGGPRARESDVLVLHGKWCSNCQVEEESDFVISERGREIQRRIWREMLDTLVKVDRRVRVIEEEHLIKKVEHGV